jgi:hypothetical protein
VVLVVLLLSTAWCIPHLGVSYTDHNNSRIGAIPTIPRAAVPAATIAAIVGAAMQSFYYSNTAAGCHQAATAASHQQLSMLQLQ